MRINEIIASLIPKVRSIGPSRDVANVERTSTLHTRPDQVQLSDESQLLSRLEHELKDQSNKIDDERVRELRERIENDDYNPDSRDIAAKILGIEK